MPSEEKISLSKGLPQGPPPGVPSTREQQARHAADMARAAAGETDDFEVPVASVQIPSGGKIYPVDSPLHDRGELDIKSMTAKEEDILTSRPLLRQGKAMTALLRSCICDKSVDPDQLLVGDRNAILIAIRVSGYGATYEARVDCPSCEEGFEHEFSLKNVPLKSLSEEPVEEGRNVFYFDLPIWKKRVAFKLLTGAEERDLTMIQERSRKAKGVGAPESNVTARLFHQVLAIGDVVDRQKLSRLVGKMPAGDSLELRSYIDKISPGVELKEFIVCPNCGESSEVDMPIGAEFFWPDARK